MAVVQTIVVVGAGGLATSACWGLAESNFPNSVAVHILDPDAVELSNLNRQIFFSASDVGIRKAPLLAKRLQEINSSQTQSTITFSGLPVRLEQPNIAELLSQASLVIDATDSAETKFLINDYCVLRGIPFCYAGAIGRRAQILAVPVGGACLRCLFPDFSSAQQTQMFATCQQAGILGAVVGAAGFLQAEAAWSLLDETNRFKASRLWRFDSERKFFTETTIPHDTLCPLGCGGRDVIRVDLRSQRCPETLLFSKIAMEKSNSNAVMELQFATRDSSENVARSLREEGFTPLELQAPNDSWILRVSPQARDTDQRERSIRQT